jgi:predicted DNA-binding transcriptional regulator AlpA
MQVSAPVDCHSAPQHKNMTDSTSLLSPRELAAFLGYYTEDGEPDTRAVYWLNFSGQGPPRYRINRRDIRYRRDEVLDWLESRRVAS